MNSNFVKGHFVHEAHEENILIVLRQCAKRVLNGDQIILVTMDVLEGQGQRQGIVERPDGLD